MMPLSVLELVPSDRVVRGRVGGSTVLFHLDDRRIHTLNETAEAVWDGLSIGESCDVIAERLAVRFGADPSIVGGDVAELAERLRSDRLVVHRADRDRAPNRRPPLLPPDTDVQGWPSTGSYRALDASIRIETEDAELGRVLAGALASLHSGQPADRALRIDTEHEDCWRVTTREGEPAIVGGRVHAAIRSLGEVNAAAIDSVPDRLVLHAAAVSTDAGAVVLPAAPDHGKSTLTAALVEAGMAYLTDEAAAVNAALDCRPFPKAIALEPGSFGVHPELAPEPRPGLGSELDERVWHVDPRRVGSVERENTPVIAVVFPRWRAGSATTVVECSPMETLPALVGQAFEFGAGGQPVFDIVCDLADRTPAWRLEYGDGTEAVEAIRRLMGGARPRARADLQSRR